MANWLRALDALLEDLGLSLRIHVATHYTVTPVPWDATPWSLRAPGMQVVHKYTFRQNTQMDKIWVKGKNRKREARWVITNKRERKKQREVNSVPLPLHTESSQRWTVPRSVRGSKAFPPHFGHGVCHNHRKETRTRVNSAPCTGASIIIFTFIERRKPRLLGATNQTLECLRGQGKVSHLWIWVSETMHA